MSDNPLDVTPERAAAIEARAKKLWQEAGSPAGREDEFHERADELMRMEMAGPAGQLPIDSGDVVEEASIQENLGEFPGASGFADQGEWHGTPMTRGELREGGDDQPLRGDAPSKGDE